MTDGSSSGFGRTLRDARERRGISLRDISNTTKIAMGALEALERNDLARLPGGIFSRGIVRSYAIEVGLDPDTAIQDFIAQFPPDSKTARHPAPTAPEDHEAIESDRRTATTFVRLIALSIPIAVALVYFGTAGRRVSTPSEVGLPPVPDPGTVDPSQASRGNPLADQPSGSSSAAPAAAVPATLRAVDSSAASESPERLRVTVSALREVWLSVSVDGEKTFERLVRPGEQHTLEGRLELVLTAADASAIVLAVNGGEARPLGPDRQAGTKRVNITNLREFAPTR
jgi:cytoskeletal protein RodZ